MTENEKYIAYSRRNGFCIGYTASQQSLQPEESNLQDGYYLDCYNNGCKLDCPKCPDRLQPEGKDQEGVCCGMIKNPDTGKYQKEPHDLCGWSCMPEQPEDLEGDWKRLYQNVITILSEDVSELLEKGDTVKLKWMLDTMVKNGKQILTTTK